MSSVEEKKFGVLSVDVVRHSFTSPTIVVQPDLVAEEVPVALVFNGISHAVMMATPLDLEDFAVGFALSEKIVDQASQIYDLEVVNAHSGIDQLGIEVHMHIAQACFARLKQKRRNLSGATGCGLCGLESLQALDLAADYSPPVNDVISVKQSVLQKAFASLSEQQTLNALTGSMHAAAWVNLDGEIELLREDVGRHNALDKLIGRLSKDTKFEKQSGFAIMSSRASYELVQKSARAQIQILATISAPTSLAIDIARRAGICLIGFVRKSGFVIYTHPERLIAE